MKKSLLAAVGTLLIVTICAVFFILFSGSNADSDPFATAESFVDAIATEQYAVAFALLHPTVVVEENLEVSLMEEVYEKENFASLGTFDFKDTVSETIAERKITTVRGVGDFDGVQKRIEVDLWLHDTGKKEIYKVYNFSVRE